MYRHLQPLAAAAVLLISCTGPEVFNCADGSKVRLTAVTDEIIRVEAVPQGAQFSESPSLCVIDRNCGAKPEVSRKDGAATFETASLKLAIDLSNGHVTFTDKASGEVLASEDTREFAPIEVDGSKGWTVRQSFLPQEEAFFGLGQHQADEWNWKGRNEELYQYNTKISIPFALSSKGYGILWDSYSFCRWGDQRPYADLGEAFILRDNDGVEGALTGTYVPKDGKTLTRREEALAQEFLRTPDCDIVRNSPESFKFNGSQVLYSGTLEARESGRHDFYLYYAGYTKVYVGGQQVMPEIWRTAWNPNGRKFSFIFTAGEQVPIRIEWKPDGDVSYCALKVLSPVPEEERQEMRWWGEMQDEIDYYFIAGGSADKVISGYRKLTGKSPIVPKWALGYWQSRERYSSQEQVLSTLKGFRDRHIPIDNIVQDWQYWKPDQWGSHEFDEARYPDPKGMVDSIHSLGGRFMISVWPKFYRGTEHFDELDANGWIYQTAIRDSVEDWLGYQQSFYDAFADGARKLFWQQMKDHLHPIGIDAWWMDASEPNIHDCTDMDYRKAMCGPTALGPSTKYFNAYALMNAQAIYEGQRASDNRRVFLLTRNGFAGLQRYSTASWSGDIGTRWEDMKAQISAGLNYALSGIPWWGQDIGGFSVENRFMQAQSIFDSTGEVTEDLKEWREMQLRWHQWGVYCPLYRAHGQWPAREPWNIAPEGDPTYEGILAVDRTRYELMPYIYSMAARVHFDDYTPMRALCMDFADDPKALEISDEFMFGDAILVCPVCSYGARCREVYLPQGSDWYDAVTGELIPGGSTFTADAPYEHIPVYCRSGRIIVKGPAVETTADTGDGSLNICIYPGSDASFCLYEDDGVSYDYEDGAFSRIRMSWDDASRTLTICGREGSYPGMIQSRQITLNAAGIGTAEARYDGNEISIKL